MDSQIINAKHQALARRAFLGGSAAAVLLALPGCQSYRHYSLVQTIRRLLYHATSDAFARLMAPGGFWDDQLARLDIPALLGSRGNVLTEILTSAAFKGRLQREFNHMAERGARRAAPLVADAVEKIGIDNARALLDGGPGAATAFLRQEMGDSLVRAMLPELADAMRLSQEPLVGQALQRLTGVEPSTLARQFSGEVDNAIWAAVAREEAAIRADPDRTNDPVLKAMLGHR